MVYRMGAIDALAMEMPGVLRAAAEQAAAPAGPHPALATARYEPYLDLCARWLAVHFGDVTGDGRLDDADAMALRANPAAFDADHDGRLTYADAAKRTGLRHSMRRGSDPLSQAEMTAGILGYRPRGFASPYGRTAPWEDKAEVLDLAVRRGMLPHLMAVPGSLPAVTEKSVAAAKKEFEVLRREDPILARKVEILAIFFGNLVPPADRSSAFTAYYGAAMVPFDRVAGGEEDAGRLAAARREANARRVAASQHLVTMQGITATVVILPSSHGAGADSAPRR